MVGLGVKIISVFFDLKRCVFFGRKIYSSKGK